MLFPQLIKANLKTRTLGRSIEYYQRLESTNLEAFELIDEDDPADGTVVITDLQIQGKGRRGRSWFASPGKAVTFSVLPKPEISTEQSGLLSLAAGTAVAEAVAQFGLSPTLKWPNDIRINGKKCGGILVETRVSGGDVKWAVIGIGINVNERTEELPEEQANGEAVRSAWLERCDHLNQTVNFSQDGEEKEGTFAGITQNGATIIETAGKEVVLTGDDISLIT